MRITIEDLDTIQREFDIRNGGWTREALSYLGLRSPLKNGWKISILHDGVPDDCPFAIGVKPQDHKWLCGKDINQNEMFEEKKLMNLRALKTSTYM